MSQPLTPAPVQLTAADLDAAWFARVRYALHYGRHRRVEAGEDGSIQIESKTQGMMPLLLPHGGVKFATKADAERVVELLLQS